VRALSFILRGKEACISVVTLQRVDKSVTLALTIDFANLWKHCCRFTHMLLFTQYNKSTWLTAISSNCLAALLPRCLRSTIICNKTPATVTSSKSFRIYSDAIFTQWRPRVEQYARRFHNMPLHSAGKGEDMSSELQACHCMWWLHKCEHCSCAVWVSYRQINCHCKN